MKTFLTFLTLVAVVAGGFVVAAHWPNVDRRIAVIDAQTMRLSMQFEKLSAKVDASLSAIRQAQEESVADLKADLGELRSGQNVVIRTQQEDRAAQWTQYQRQNKVMRHFHHHHPSQGEFE